MVVENFNKSSKEQVRAWLMARRQAPVPLPDIERIRLDLGWRTTTADPAPALRIIASQIVQSNTRATFARPGGATARS